MQQKHRATIADLIECDIEPSLKGILDWIRKTSQRLSICYDEVKGSWKSTPLPILGTLSGDANHVDRKVPFRRSTCCNYSLSALDIILRYHVERHDS